MTPETQILKFPTAKFLRDGSDWEQRIGVSVRGSKEDAMRDIVLEIQKKMRYMPVIVIIANNDAQVLDAVAKGGREMQDLNVLHFTDPYDAMGAKTDASMVTNGLYILQEKFACGFDLKFARNAHVVVFSDRSHYSASMIRQMVGRANRAQGTAYGRVFCVQENPMRPETDMNYIEAIDKARNNDIGRSVIHWLLDKFLKLNA